MAASEIDSFNAFICVGYACFCDFFFFALGDGDYCIPINCEINSAFLVSSFIIEFL